MLKKRHYILLLLSICCYQVSFSQNAKTKKDTTEAKGKTQAHPIKNKLTLLLKGLNVEPTNSNLLNVKQKKYLEYEGKIIRNIKITTLDPFGYSEMDSTSKPKSWLQITGNRIHLKTKQLAINNLLLLQKNKPFDSLLVKESERLIRSQQYIRSVRITQELAGINSDSVDVYIRVLDTWSTVPKANISSSKAYFGLDERNFLGLGHQLKNRYTDRLEDNKRMYDLEYSIPNIKNTYIRTTLNYHTESDNSHSKGINIERPFYSPLTKWAGGIYMDQQFRKDTLQNSKLIYSKQIFKFKTQDFWIGHAFRLFKGNTINERTTNLIVSARFLNLNYTENPTIEFDSIHFYSGEQFFLSGIGITTRKFVQDSYLFKNGITEDVPVGRTYGITGGYQYKNNLGRAYLGGQASFGKYHQWGFLSTNFEFGTFFDKSTTSQTVFSLQANYFTHLIEIGTWKLRQFVKPQLIIGLNRMNSVGDQLSINENNGIPGFNTALYGTKKIVLTLQTQAYAPWNIMGFRLNPYLNYSFALLGNDNIGLLKSKAYSKIGIGLIINNDYLVFSSFQLSFSYYPSIPFKGEDIFKINSFATSDIGLQDFELAKPRTVLFK
jgi:hypothetical protein